MERRSFVFSQTVERLPNVDRAPPGLQNSWSGGAAALQAPGHRSRSTRTARRRRGSGTAPPRARARVWPAPCRAARTVFFSCLSWPHVNKLLGPPLSLGRFMSRGSQKCPPPLQLLYHEPVSASATRSASIERGVPRKEYIYRDRLKSRRSCAVCTCKRFYEYPWQTSMYCIYEIN